MNITQFMAWFVSNIVSIFAYAFNLLDKISFAGISLLDFSITVLLISIVLPIILTLVKSDVINKYKTERRKGQAYDQKDKSNTD